MPRDIALTTNTPVASLALRQVQPLGDGHHVATFLVVRSGAFAAALPFVFTQQALTRFVTQLGALASTESLDVSVRGDAVLTARAHGDHISFVAIDDDVVRVMGELREPDVRQLLQFSFESTRTAAAAFASQLNEMLRAATIREPVLEKES